MNKLTEIIINKIKDAGRITFAEFMELALYHPKYGYYTAGKSNIGKYGDFYTSPHVHRAFGSVIGNFILKSFQLIDKEKFAIVELGAGKGFLALDILNHIKTHNISFYEEINYYIVENNSSSKNESKETLREHTNKVKWFSELTEIESENIAGVVLSNELFDALPFHRLKFLDGDLAEIYVTLENGHLAEIVDKPSSKNLEEYINKTDIDLIDGQEFEINLNSNKILNQIDKTLHKGFILTIDYGFLASELFNPERINGTYKCIYKHEINEKPYIHLGDQDITAHVDFSNLIKTGEKLALNKVQYTTQGQFLIDWGILDLINSNIEENRESETPAEKEIQAIKNLFLPELMGDKFKVLIQEKNLSNNLEGFYPESPFKISFKVL